MTKTTTQPEPIFLYVGGHDADSGKFCFNEAIAWLAGEPHSAYPQCASPYARRMGMVLNDRLDDERRQLLRPFVLRSLGTAGDGRDPERHQMCVEWLAEYLPALFDRAGLTDQAQELRGLLSADLAQENVLRVLRSARSSAWEARDKAWSELRSQIRAEFAKRGITAKSSTEEIADAVAAVAAEAAAAAVAAAVAAVAAAEVAAAAAEVAAVAAAVAAEAAVAAVAAAAVAAAVVAAVAEAAVAAVAAEAAEVAAVAAAVGSSRYREIRNAVYKRVLPKMRELLDPNDELLQSALDLFDRMLPAEPLQAPVIEGAELLFAAPGAS